MSTAENKNENIKKQKTKLSRHLKEFIGGIILILIVFFISRYVVKKYKKPGAMTVIESQAMDMSVMKAPVGSVPVATEIIGSAPLEEKVTYTGSVVPYNEVDVYPRVTGWLKNLKVYAGDKVSAGQLIANLEAKELSSQLAEANYANIAQQHEAEMTQYDAQEVQKKVWVAESQLDEAKAGYKNSIADYDYWEGEIKRQEELLKQGAVSKQEYDMEKSNFEKSKAMVNESMAKIEIAEQDLMAMQDSANSAKHKAITSKSMVNQTAAAKNTVKIFNSYKQIYAPISGYVTKRFLSPGVLVSPGVSILKIAQINKVRLQANVAEADMQFIEVGNPVIVSSLKNPDKKFYTKVSSVFPAADPTSRTSIIEAVINNYGLNFLPGDYIVMQITKRKKDNTISIPTKAITYLNDENKPSVWVVRNIKSGKIIYQCTMHPEVKSDKPGKCYKCGMDLVPTQTVSGKKAHLVYVTTGITNGDRTEILSGINKGDEIIYVGYENLKEGDAVFPTKWGETGAIKLPTPPAMEDMPGMDNSGNNKSNEKNNNIQNMDNMPDKKHDTQQKDSNKNDDMENMPGMN